VAHNVLTGDNLGLNYEREVKAKQGTTRSADLEESSKAQINFEAYIARRNMSLLFKMAGYRAAAYGVFGDIFADGVPFSGLSSLPKPPQEHTDSDLDDIASMDSGYFTVNSDDKSTSSQESDYFSVDVSDTSSVSSNSSDSLENEDFEPSSIDTVESDDPNVKSDDVHDHDSVMAILISLLFGEKATSKNEPADAEEMLESNELESSIVQFMSWVTEMLQGDKVSGSEEQGPVSQYEAGSLDNTEGLQDQLGRSFLTGALNAGQDMGLTFPMMVLSRLFQTGTPLHKNPLDYYKSCGQFTLPYSLVVGVGDAANTYAKHKGLAEMLTTIGAASFIGATLAAPLEAPVLWWHSYPSGTIQGYVNAAKELGLRGIYRGAPLTGVRDAFSGLAFLKGPEIIERLGRRQR